MKKSDMIKAMCDTFYEHLERNTIDEIMEIILTKQEELGMERPKHLARRHGLEGWSSDWEKES